jgi:hypothetical protein
MNYEEDFDLARRLRRISDDPEPAVPGSLYRYLDRVGELAAVEDVRPTRSISIAVMPQVRTPGRLHLKVMAGIAAALVVAVAGGVLLAAQRYGGPVAASQPAAASVPAKDLWTGLEWHDITATSSGLFAADPWESGISSATVVAWPGGLAATTGSGVWTSTDGRAWKQVSGPQYVKFLGAIGGRLLGISDPVGSCEETATGPCMTSGRIWASTNGADWTSELLPFSGSAIGLTTASGSAVVTVVGATSTDPTGPRVVYVTMDGRNWRQASVPDDMSTSFELRVLSMGAGYMALGEATLGDEGTLGCWISSDGFTWLRISPALPNHQTLMLGVFKGLLGLASPGLLGTEGLHSADGLVWVRDQDQVLSGLGGANQLMADGRRILVAGNWNTDFHASLGDGHWQLLEQGGDIGSLPGGGQAWLLPNGVLYAGGGRLFFGQAISGTTIEGTLRPAATITPPPTPRPAAGASQSTIPSSVIPAPTSQPTPTPTPTPTGS